VSQEDLVIALRRGPQTSRGKGCIVARTLNSFLSDERTEEHDALKVAFDEPEADGSYTWSAPALAKLLRDKEEITIAPSSIQRHRNGSCACSR
jgi:hypothetical protein